MRTLFFLFSLLIYNSIYSQNTQDKELAKIGNHIIYESEFIERYELTPSFNKHVNRNSIAAKLQFLYTLCSEKLWAIEAGEQNKFLQPEVDLAIKSVEKMYLRDALYKTEILDKIIITEEEKFEGLVKNANSLYLKFIFTKEKSAIILLHDLLTQGVPFDSILAERPEKFEQQSPIIISFGNMQQNAEEEVYKLKKGKYTPPILTTDGWYIFYLENIEERIFDTAQDREDAIAYVEKTIEKRKATILLQEFMADFFKGIKVDVDSRIFESLSNKLQKSFTEKMLASQNPKPNDLIHLQTEDILSIENEFGEDSLKMSFVKMPGNDVSLGKFIREMAFDGFYIEHRYAHNIRYELDKRVKKFIEFELLAAEAYRRGLQFSPEVKNSIQMWNDNYMHQALKADLYDDADISDDDVYSYYKTIYSESYTPPQVNIIEILINDIELIPEIQNKIERKIDFKQLAKDYSIREFTKNSAGEFGYFPVTMHGEIGRIASGMEIGQTFGPLKVDEGYSFFKVIGKKDSINAPASKSFEEVKTALKQELKQKNLFKDLIDSTVDFAKKNKIKINLNNLQQVEVTNLNTFAIRHMGFGGKITAVPLLAPFTEWVEEYKKINPELP